MAGYWLASYKRPGLRTDASLHFNVMRGPWHTSHSLLTDATSGRRKCSTTPPIWRTAFALPAAAFRPLPAPGACLPRLPPSPGTWRAWVSDCQVRDGNPAEHWCTQLLTDCGGAAGQHLLSNPHSTICRGLLQTSACNTSCKNAHTGSMLRASSRLLKIKLNPWLVE